MILTIHWVKALAVSSGRENTNIITIVDVHENNLDD